MEQHRLEYTNHMVLGDISTGRFCLLVPQTYETMFRKLHSLSHGGVKAASKLVEKMYMFSGMRANIKEKCRSCLACQKSQGKAKLH